MFQEYLAREARRLDGRSWQTSRRWPIGSSCGRSWKEQYFHMLGLWPLPEKTPLDATVTGTLDGRRLRRREAPLPEPAAAVRDGQSLSAGRRSKPGQRLPAVFYVCGHSNQGRDGQQDGLPVARHLVRPARLRLPGGRFAATRRDRGDPPRHVPREPLVVALARLHAGRRRVLERHPRHRLPAEPAGRGPAAASRVTGISGGGAATFWIAAADERVQVAVPVSGMADLESYVANRVINGHCDCMFLYNTFQWPWTRIAALVAPRPMLFTNSDHDAIFPMDANDRVINRLERLYSLYGESDLVDAMVSIGGHAYRQDLRQAAYRFINTAPEERPADRRGQRSRPGRRRGQGQTLSDRAREAARLPHRRRSAQGRVEHEDRRALRAGGQGRAAGRGPVRGLEGGAAGRTAAGHVRLLPRPHPAGPSGASE